MFVSWRKLRMFTEMKLSLIVVLLLVVVVLAAARRYNRLLSRRSSLLSSFSILDEELIRKRELIRRAIERLGGECPLDAASAEKARHALEAAKAASDLAHPDPTARGVMATLSREEASLDEILTRFPARAPTPPELVASLNRLCRLRREYNFEAEAYNRCRERLPELLFAFLLGFREASPMEQV